MGMVFCRGCGKEIHESAPACPHCGAPQTALAAEGSDKFFDLCMQPLRRYATFTGRARRKEYWYFFLVCVLASGVFSAIHPALYGLFWLAFLLPSLAVGVRRLHDTDRSGWWLIVPIVGFVFLCFEGQPGPNRFGASPK
jgi:uncharacterized membrane protein YhaH (DUF805 family)